MVTVSFPTEGPIHQSRELWPNSSAFDKLNLAKAVQALIDKGVPRNIALWYKNYLTSRYLHLEVKGIEISREVSIGCPQGGVLSTLLWNIAFYDLLKIFDRTGIVIIGYADDGGIMVTGNNIMHSSKP